MRRRGRARCKEQVSSGPARAESMCEFGGKKSVSSSSLSFFNFFHSFSRSRPIEPFLFFSSKTCALFVYSSATMEAFYILLFAAIAATTVFFELGKGRLSSSSTSSSGATSLTRDCLAFRNNYVLVYALMMGEDKLYQLI